MQGNGYERRLNWSDNGLTDVADTTFFNASYTASTVTGGKGRVSSLSVGNRKGYAGYEFDEAASVYHVRHRVYLPESGRWSRRDPIEYRAGNNLYEYVRSFPFRAVDPTGLIWCVCGAPGCGQPGDATGPGCGADMQPAPPGEAVPCNQLGSLTACMTCCLSDKIDTVQCVRTCYALLNPGDVILPPPKVGPPTGEQSACQKACAGASGGALGIVTCSGGTPIACSCPADPRWGDLPPGSGQCVGLHELINLENYSCEGVPDGGRPRQRGGRKEGWCNESWAFYAMAQCLSSTQCNQADERSRCLCTAARDTMISWSNCRAQAYGIGCQGGTDNDMMARLSTCDDTRRADLADRKSRCN
jgi:RHS repeat-associated protein